MADKKAKTPEIDKNTGSGSSTTIIIVVVVLALVFFIWNFSKGKQGGPGSPAASPTAAIQGQDMTADALTLVKSYKGPKTYMDLEKRLESYKGKIETELKTKIEGMTWSAKIDENRNDPNRYLVTMEWAENGKPVQFIWEADLATKTVTPSNEPAKAVDAFDEELLAGGSKTEAGETPATEASPGTSPSPEVKPLTDDSNKGEDVKIDVLPPKDASGIVPPPVPAEEKKGSKKKTAAIESEEGGIPSIDEPESFYSLTGVMTVSGKKNIMLEKDGRGFTGNIGTKLPGGWVVSSAANNNVVLKKGKEKRVLTLKEGGPMPARSSKKGEYPKASKGGSNESQSFQEGDEEAPPPPEPGGNPTVIPTN